MIAYPRGITLGSCVFDIQLNGLRILYLPEYSLKPELSVPSLNPI